MLDDMNIYSVWDKVGMFYHINLCYTGVAFSRQVSRSLVLVAMETKGQSLHCCIFGHLF